MSRVVSMLLKLISSLALLLLVCATFVPAQERRGNITGTVTDSTGAVLPGALLQLQPGGKRAVSDTQGTFRIGDVMAGSYEVTCTYVGFSVFTSKINVGADQVITLNPVLRISSNEQVTVTSERLREALSNPAI